MVTQMSVVSVSTYNLWCGISAESLIVDLTSAPILSHSQVTRAAAALGKLLQNIRGPNDSRRRLYAGVLRYMPRIDLPCGLTSCIPRPKRFCVNWVLAIRVTRVYRTIFNDVVYLLPTLGPRKNSSVTHHLRRGCWCDPLNSCGTHFLSFAFFEKLISYIIIIWYIHI